MTTKIVPRMDINEFREKGYLQEVNRLFFHPLGLALEITIDEDTGTETITGVWDYRNNEEGIVFNFKNFKKMQTKIFKERAERIKKEMDKKGTIRIDKFGWAIQPVPEE